MTYSRGKRHIGNALLTVLTVMKQPFKIKLNTGRQTWVECRLPVSCLGHATKMYKIPFVETENILWPPDHFLTLVLALTMLPWEWPRLLMPFTSLRPSPAPCEVIGGRRRWTQILRNGLCVCPFSNGVAVAPFPNPPQTFANNPRIPRTTQLSWYQPSV